MEEEPQLVKKQPAKKIKKIDPKVPKIYKGGRIYDHGKYLMVHVKPRDKVGQKIPYTDAPCQRMIAYKKANVLIDKAVA